MEPKVVAQARELTVVVSRWLGMRRHVILAATFGAVACCATARVHAQAGHGVSIFKQCGGAVCEGELTTCDISAVHADLFGDTTTIVEAWDTVDPSGLNIRIPAVGNLPIVSVFGNTNCSVGGSLPCNIGPANSVLNGLPGAPSPGFVTFRSQYLVQPGDPNPLFDQGTVRVQDRCDAPGSVNCSGVISSVQFTSATDILTCEDENNCTTDCCVPWDRTDPDPGNWVPAHCTNTSVCTDTTCDGSALPLDCEDNLLCTVDACDDTNPETCCSSTPLCPDPERPCCADGASCDDGDDCTDDVCDTDGCCTYIPVCICGDGDIDPGELCDGAAQAPGVSCNSACRSSCTCCGDGVPNNGEQCDDGNNVNDDACSNTCQSARCGDGIVQPGEVCDDGNLNDNDDCSNNCTTGCGNGIVNTGEQCDDGNLVNDDGCTNDCTTPRCGDGIIQAGELCDDGNNLPGDGCSPTCTPEFCGNGVLDPNEICDGPANAACNGANCLPNCTCETELCGNNILDAGEECDGSANEACGGGFCQPDCTCGNDIPTVSEWGLAILTLLLLTAAKLRVTERRTA